MSINKKLLDLRKKVTKLSKDGDNQHQHFKYVSSANVLETIRPIMDSLGLLLIPSVTQSNLNIIEGSKIPFLVELWIEYTLLDVDSGESIKINWYAQGSDSGERGVGKAYTYGEKYFLLKLLQIPTNDDDPDGKDIQPTTVKSYSSSSSSSGGALSPKQQKYLNDLHLDIKKECEGTDANVILTLLSGYDVKKISDLDINKAILFLKDLRSQKV